MPEQRTVNLRVNSIPYSVSIEPRRLLADVIREDLGLTGTHIGCEHGVCGACTVLINGRSARACLMLGVQAEDTDILTVEGIAVTDELHPLQAAFSAHHGLQCGFCTPGMLITALELLSANAHPTADQVRAAISGNLCRCTGYQNIVIAILAAAETLSPRPPP